MSTYSYCKSIDGDTYEGFSRDARGKLRYVDPDGEMTLIITGQGTSQTEIREPVAADAVHSTAGWTALVYAALLVALGFVLGAVMV